MTPTEAAGQLRAALAPGAMLCYVRRQHRHEFSLWDVRSAALEPIGALVGAALSLPYLYSRSALYLDRLDSPERVTARLSSVLYGSPDLLRFQIL